MTAFFTSSAILTLFLHIVGIASLSPGNATDNKAKTLTILAFITFTGSEPLDGRSCKAGMQLAVDAVNERQDFLPGYRVDVVYRDEGRVGTLTPKFLVDYLNSNQSVINLMSPAIVGPRYSCQHSARTAAFYNMVQFTVGCGGQMFTANRHAFPNLYRQATPFDNTIMAKVAFMHKIGKWKQIAIITYSGNPNELITAQRLYSIHVGAGFQVVQFLSIPEVSYDVIMSLKESDSRIIVLETVQNSLVIPFLCLAYIGGLRGPRYVFVMSTYTYVDPESANLVLPPSCTRSMLIEQMQITFLAGNFLPAIENNGPTSVGYDLTEFERRFDKLLGPTRLADYGTRHMCSDAMIQALVSLNRAEQRLKAKNRTLSDFSSYPKTVMTAVNESASQGDFVGLRIGRMLYSDRLEVDREVLRVAQWQSALGFRIVYKVTFLGNLSSLTFDPKFYNIEEQKEAPCWKTRSGKPPKDLSDVNKVYYRLPDGVTYTVIAIASLLVVVNAALSFLTREASITNHVTLQFVLESTSSITRRTTFIGSTLIYLGCITFVLDSSLHPQFICNARIVLLFLGLSFIDGIQLSLTLILRKITKKVTFAVTPSLRMASSNVQQQQQSSVAESSTSQTVACFTYGDNFDFELISISCHCVLFIVNAIVLGVWLGTSPMQHVSTNSPLLFDDNTDAYFFVVTYYCVSANSTIFLFLLLACHGFVFLFCLCALIVGAVQFSIRLPYNSCSDGFSRLTEYARTSVINSLTIVLAMIVSLSILPENKVTLQTSIIAFGALAFSGSTVLIHCRPMLSPNRDVRPSADSPVPSTSVVKMADNQTTLKVANNNIAHQQIVSPKHCVHNDVIVGV